jgi:hypothetical protein
MSIPLFGEHVTTIGAAKVDGFVKSHQRAPCGAPKSMTGNAARVGRSDQ